MPTLGEQMRARREELALSQNRAAKIAKASRTTWINWETDRAVPERFNYVRIEMVLKWERGSVDAIKRGEAPTPLRREHAPPSIELMLAELGMDPKVFARQSRTLRENLYQAWLIDRNRRLSEGSDASAGGDNPPMEGRADRRA